MTLKQACSSEYQGAQDAFKDSMIHWILQFTLLIAFRCVLHRCESQEIRCWKLYFYHLKAFLLKTYNLIPYTYSRVYKNVIDSQTHLKRSIHYITTNLSFPKCLQNMHRRKYEWNKQQQTCTCSFKPATALATHSPSIMILPQVHLRKPCYDFYFL